MWSPRGCNFNDLIFGLLWLHSGHNVVTNFKPLFMVTICGLKFTVFLQCVAPSAAGLGTTTAAKAEGGHGASAPAGAGGGASAPAGAGRRTLGRNRSPPLVLTMFGGGADREWEDDNGTKGEECIG